MYVCYTDFPRLVTDSPVGLAATCYHLFESQSCTATVYKLFFFYFLCGWSFLDRGRENRALFGFINFKTPLDFNPKGTRKKRFGFVLWAPHFLRVHVACFKQSRGGTHCGCGFSYNCLFSGWVMVVKIRKIVISRLF